MQHDNISVSHQVWYDSAHASLCVLGVHLRRIHFSGAKAVSHTATTVRVDPALIAAFGLPGCAEQSVIAATLNAATQQDVADLQAALGEIYGCYGQARRHPFKRELLVLDVDLSPLPASQRAEGSQRGYMGRCRSGDRAQTGARASGRHSRNHLGDGGVGPHR
jgi:hypothetical protein